MSIFTTSRRSSVAEMAKEIERCHGVIISLERSIEELRREISRLKSNSTSEQIRA